MKIWGIALAIGGVVLAMVALLMGSTMPQEMPYSADLPSLTRTQEMHNLPRAQLQMLLFMGGCALFVGGAVLGAVGQLEETMRRLPGFIRHEASVDVAGQEDICPAAASPAAVMTVAQHEIDRTGYVMAAVIGVPLAIMLVAVLVR